MKNDFRHSENEKNSTQGAPTPASGTPLYQQLGLGTLALLIGIAAGVLASPRGRQTSSIPGGPTTSTTMEATGKAREALVQIGAIPTDHPPTPIQHDESEDGGSDVNFALARNGASVTGGSFADVMIDGKTDGYDGVKGFAWINWTLKPTPAFIITLRESVKINTIRLLLWDLDTRFYRYKLEIHPALSGKDWMVVADFTGKHHKRRSWQNINFDLQTVRRIRITGTYNSENNGFNVVEVQAFRLSKILRTAVGDLEF